MHPVEHSFTGCSTICRRVSVSCPKVWHRKVPFLPVLGRGATISGDSDTADRVLHQARRIATWGSNVYVKIPVTNTRREPAAPLIRRLSREGVKLNVTAILTLDQVREVVEALAGGAPANVSVFAGRIADTGIDPVPLMAEAVRMLKPHPQMELIWASPRELLNIFHADCVGCHIITVSHDVLKKLPLVGKDLTEYSLETVQMFANDAAKSGFVL